MAIAPGDSGGTPGSWRKWYSGSFSEPGLGGKTSVIGWFGSFASIHAPSDSVVLLADDPWFGGVRLSYSSDGIAFQSLPEPLLLMDEGDWVRKPTSGELIAYSSIVPPRGGKSWSDDFYLAYCYLPPGAGFDQRYQVVRHVALEANQPLSTLPRVRVALTRYYSEARKDHWVTTQAVPADYKTDGVLGYVYTAKAAAMRKLVDCHILASDDHIVVADACGAGQTFLRTLGWVYTSREPGTIPLYSCYLEATTDHWVSSRPCEQEVLGATTELVLGHIEPVARVPRGRLRSVRSAPGMTAGHLVPP